MFSFKIKSLHLLLLSVVAAGILGCGGDGGSGGGSAPVETGDIQGYLYDSPIVGVNYECGNKRGLTDSEGMFVCDTLPVVFKIGALKIGILSKMSVDSIIFPQDLLGLDRNNETDTDLVALVQFLQALDDDGDITARITITQAARDKFPPEGGDEAGEGGLPGAAEDAGIVLPSPETAMKHLRDSMRPDADKPADTSDISPFVGDWVGNGAGWEVRFKHTSGDFAAQFTGVDKDELPFNNEKIIMSLMVEHQNTFVIHVDEQGKITGDGYITYNLIPNLCGVSALVTQVNSAVNMLDKIEFFFTLGGKIGAATVEKFVEESRHFGNAVMDTALAAYQTGNSAASIFSQDVGNQLLGAAKKMTQDGDNSAGVCRVAAGIASYGGGNKIGPMTVEELVKGSSLDIAKTLVFDIANPVGLMLSIPGVTQVQYEYKGLQNGPELRYYTISGHIADGKMYLDVDQMEEPFDLTVEYTVNYQTETPTFPVWSPFLSEGGTVHAADRDIVVYKTVPKTEEKSYVDRADGNKVKIVEVTTEELKPEEKNLPFPTAVFSKKGKQRNGVSVWHEYEYVWKAYKVND